MLYIFINVSGFILIIYDSISISGDILAVSLFLKQSFTASMITTARLAQTMKMSMRTTTTR